MTVKVNSQIVRNVNCIVLSLRLKRKFIGRGEEIRWGRVTYRTDKRCNYFGLLILRKG